MRSYKNLGSLKLFFRYASWISRNTPWIPLKAYSQGWGGSCSDWWLDPYRIDMMDSILCLLKWQATFSVHSVHLHSVRCSRCSLLIKGHFDFVSQAWEPYSGDSAFWECVWKPPSAQNILGAVLPIPGQSYFPVQGAWFLSCFVFWLVGSPFPCQELNLGPSSESTTS